VRLAVVVVVVTGARGESCSRVQTRAMQQTFTDCSRNISETQHSDQAAGWECELVRAVVEECGKLWLRCHTAREVRRMRDLHIEALIRQYGGPGVMETCPVVREYRESGRSQDDPVEEVLCSDERTVEIQTEFQTCSHSTSTAVYQAIHSLSSAKLVANKLCKALTTIGTVCIKKLSECFAVEDLLQMRKSHLEEMKNFLLRISSEKVSDDALDNCKVMEYTEESFSEEIATEQESSGTEEATTASVTSSVTSVTPGVTTSEVGGKGYRSAEFTMSESVENGTETVIYKYLQNETALVGEEETAAEMKEVEEEEEEKEEEDAADESDDAVDHVSDESREEAERLQYSVGAGVPGGGAGLHLTSLSLLPPLLARLIL